MEATTKISLAWLIENPSKKNKLPTAIIKNKNME